MTQKERIATVSLMGAARSAASEIESYCRDFDSSTLKSVADNLREAIKEFRKVAKI